MSVYSGGLVSESKGDGHTENFVQVVKYFH